MARGGPRLVPSSRAPNSVVDPNDVFRIRIQIIFKNKIFIFVGRTLLGRASGS